MSGWECRIWGWCETDFLDVSSCIFFYSTQEPNDKTAWKVYEFKMMKIHFFTLKLFPISTYPIFSILNTCFPSFWKFPLNDRFSSTRASAQTSSFMLSLPRQTRKWNLYWNSNECNEIGVVNAIKWNLPEISHFLNNLKTTWIRYENGKCLSPTHFSRFECEKNISWKHWLADLIVTQTVPEKKLKPWKIGKCVLFPP